MNAGTPPLLASVVVPTYRRPELLRRCLERLLMQTMPPANYEVIVVDDGHDLATQALVAELAPATGGPSLAYLRPSVGRGPAVARNAGWAAARGQVVAFTDDDTVPDLGWLAAGVGALRSNPEWSGACGAVRVPLSAPMPRRPTDHELMTQGLERAEFVTANAFVRHAALRTIGGFDERYTRAWREDSDLQFRLMRDAGPVGRAPDAVVLHPARPERWGVCIRQQRNSFFEALLYREHPRLYRERISAGPPGLHYFVVGTAVTAVVAGLVGAGTTALASAVLCVGGVFATAFRRLRRTSLAPAHVWEMLATSAVIPFLSVYWRLRGALRFRVFFI